MSNWSSWALDLARSDQDHDNWHVYRAAAVGGSYQYDQAHYPRHIYQEYVTKPQFASLSHPSSSAQLIESLNNPAQPMASSKCWSESNPSTADGASGNGYGGTDDDMSRAVHNLEIGSSNPFRPHAAAASSTNPFRGNSNPFLSSPNPTPSRNGRSRRSETPAAHPGYGSTNGYADTASAGYLLPGQLNPLQRGSRRAQTPAVSSSQDRNGGSTRRPASSQSRRTAPPARSQSAMAFSSPHSSEPPTYVSSTDYPSYGSVLMRFMIQNNLAPIMRDQLAVIGLRHSCIMKSSAVTSRIKLTASEDRV
jgi:hypothetical protein